MRIAVGADHAGYEMKETLRTLLSEQGHAVTDFGTHSTESVDFPDYAAYVATAVQDGRVERGLMICGSGAGAVIACNKVNGVRAFHGHDVYTAHQAVEHDSANLLCLGSRVQGIEVVKEIVTSFLAAEFVREEHFIRRLSKVIALEESD